MTAARPPRALPWVLLVAGALGTLAAFVLTVEKIRVLEDPTYIPSCSINPVLSCGSVMTSDQAEAFGFPNPLLGLVGFPIVAALGALVRRGVELPRWIWRTLQAGTTAAAVFVGWLTFQSLYRIGALCPYCLVVWALMPPLLIGVTIHNVQAGHLGARLARVGPSIRGAQPIVTTVWYLTVLTLILIRFWDYWKTLP